MGRQLQNRAEVEAGWKAAPERVIVPYVNPHDLPELLASRAGHEKPCLKLGGPSSKAKYAVMTDSELVP